MGVAVGAGFEAGGVKCVKLWFAKDGKCRQLLRTAFECYSEW